MTNIRVTNQSVADALGIDPSYVSLIRRGLRVPSRDIVVALVEAYEDLDSAELLNAYTNPDPAVFAACFRRITGLPDPDPTELQRPPAELFRPEVPLQSEPR